MSEARAMMGRIRDAVSLWGLGGLLRDVPELKEAWEDPLFEHAREAGRLELHADTQLLITFHLLGFMLTFCLLAAVVPAEWHLRSLWAVMGLTWFLLLVRVHLRRVGRDRLLFLHRSEHPVWEDISIDPARIARLVALKAVLQFDWRGESTKKGTPYSEPFAINAWLLILAGKLPEIGVSVPSQGIALAGSLIIALVVSYHSLLSMESWGICRGWNGLEAFSEQLREHWWVRREMFLHPEVRRTWTGEWASGVRLLAHASGVLLLCLILSFECASALYSGNLVRPVAVAALCVCALSARHLWHRLRERSRDLLEFSEAIRDFEGMMALWRRGPSEVEPED